MDRGLSCYEAGMSRACTFALPLVVAAALAPGCKKDEASASKPAAAPAAATTPAACLPAGERHGALSWIKDDYPRAAACAQARGVPLVIDMWAPWCHTCLSMQEYVLNDASFAAIADRFVFLALDTDREENAPALEKFPVSAWPTFYVVSPADGVVHSRFLGSTSVAGVRDLLHAGEQSFLDGAALAAGSPLALLRTGDRAMVAAMQLPKGDPARAARLDEAHAAYEQALATAPADWSRRPDVLVSLIGVKARRSESAACVALATAQMARTGTAASASDFMVYGLGCADELAATDAAAARAFRDLAVVRLEALLADPASLLSVDDRSDAMINLRQTYDALDRHADALATADKQRAMLDAAAASAPSPTAAGTFNFHRAEVYAYLGRHAELVPALEQSAAALPQDYDPPYRLAGLYEDAKQPDLALRWAQQANALAYGPRKARVAAMIARIHKARGDAAAERAARLEVIAISEALPAGQQQPDALAEARRALAAMDQAPAAP